MDRFDPDPSAQQTGTVLRIHPHGQVAVALRGLYLSHDLRAAGDPARPFVYTNFIASLDGRISEAGPGRRRQVPQAIANTRDWRLYLELLAQADVVLTTARHLRAVAAGRQRSPDLTEAAAEGLIEWRVARGLSPAPAIAVLSEQLRIPVRDVLRKCSGPLHLLTHQGVPDAQVQALQDEGADVHRVGVAPILTAAEVLSVLTAQGYRNIYSIAGPHVLHTLLEGNALDRLYLTIAQLVLGGEGDTMMPTIALETPARFKLEALYLDPYAPKGAGQMLMTLHCAHCHTTRGTATEPT
jgi:riboflavin biosynthesis pyrimidine reductase